MKPIILKINLPGVIKGPVAHTTKQSHTAYLMSGGSMTKRILHTDREFTNPHKKLVLEPEITMGVVEGECPYWETPSMWRKLNRTQKLLSFLGQFDEGYGFSYEYIE